MSKKIFDEVLEVRGLGTNAHYLIKPLTAHSFFADGTLVRKIPLYQRPFSWSENNIKELLDDVIAIVSETKGWFLGPIFTTHEPNTNHGVSFLLDGQQRVTTIQLILLEAYVIKFSSNPPLATALEQELNDLRDRLTVVLRKDQGGQWVPIFTPDPSITEVYLKYFNNAFTTNSYDSWDDNHKEVNASHGSNWITGYETFKNAIKIIRKRLLAILYNDGNGATDASVKKFCKVIYKLLYDCWFIEIPLQKEEYVLDIFETLNNRGKPLSLTDILKFKTLTVANSSNQVTGMWSEIFQKVDKLESLGLISDEDDFFKYLLITHANGKDLNDDKELVGFFSQGICSSESTILVFLTDTIKLCNFLIDVYEVDGISSQFRKLSLRPKELSRLKVIFSVLKFARKCTDNSRFLLFYFGRKITVEKASIQVIKIFVFNLIRAVLYNVVYLDKKSNTIRTDFLQLIADFESGRVDYENYLDSRGWSDISNFTYNYNLVSVKDATSANLILAFHQLFTQKTEILINYAQSQYMNAQSEHFMPIKWQENWSNSCYSKIDIHDFIEQFKTTQKYQDIIYEHKDDLLSKIALNVAELQLGTSLRRSEISNTIIDFIGNKWLLNAGLNNTQKNYDYFSKKEIIYNNSRSFLMIPMPNDSEIGLDLYSEFSYKEIIMRSLSIFDLLIKKYRNTVEDIVV